MLNLKAKENTSVFAVVVTCLGKQSWHQIILFPLVSHLASKNDDFAPANPLSTSSATPLKDLTISF